MIGVVVGAVLMVGGTIIVAIMLSSVVVIGVALK
jgi:hypothetical protein